MIPPPIVLARGEVRVWYTRLAGLSEGEFAACRAILAAEEIERADRFRFESDRRASIAGRALARGALARCGGASPEAWVFALNEWGKPSAAAPGARSLELSVSHTRTIVVCAVAEEMPIGVDAEDCDKPVDIDEVAARHFAPAEQALITGAAKLQAFYELWTLKEAYVKARGMGLSIPLTSFWFDRLDGAIAISFADGVEDDAEAWQFRRIAAPQPHTIALAVRSGGTPVSIIAEELTSIAGTTRRT